MIPELVALVELFEDFRQPPQDADLVGLGGSAGAAVERMLDAAIKAVSQLLSPSFRSVLLKSVGLAIALLAVVFIVLYRLLAWLRDAGISSLEGTIGPVSHEPLVILAWLLAVALGLGLFTGAIFLMPAVTSLVASFFCDEIAELSPQLVTFNGNSFDLPVLRCRAMIHGVSAPTWTS